METLWPLQPSTEAKHRLYSRYLDAWWPIMLQRPGVDRVTYVDAFAGPGEYSSHEVGSPVIAIERLLNHVARTRMNLTRDRVTLLFVEADLRRYRHLSNLLHKKFGPLDRLPVTVEIHCGRAEVDTCRLLTSVGAWGHPILAIFDSWGNVGVSWQDIKSIARNQSSETIVTFGPNWFSRREGEEPQKLDGVFGGRTFWTPSDPRWTSNERWEHWIEAYRRAILRAGFEWAVQFEIVPRTGQPLDLFFGTNHKSGVAAFKDAMWKVDRSDGLRFNDPRTAAAKSNAARIAQPSFFDDPDSLDGELANFVLEAVSHGLSTVREVCDYLLRETSRWRDTDGRKAIRQLLDDGTLTRDPVAGQLTGDVRLALSAG